MALHLQSEETKDSLIRNAKARAKRNNVPFNLEVEDISIPEKCPLTDIPLVTHIGSGKQGPRFNSPTIDRVIPERGYVLGNIEIISNLANALMGQETNPDLLQRAAQTFADRIHSYHAKERHYEEHSSRHRDGWITSNNDKDTLYGNPRHRNKRSSQLRLDFDVFRNEDIK